MYNAKPDWTKQKKKENNNDVSTAIWNDNNDKKICRTTPTVTEYNTQAAPINGILVVCMVWIEWIGNALYSWVLSAFQTIVVC